MISPPTIIRIVRRSCGLVHCDWRRLAIELDDTEEVEAVAEVEFDMSVELSARAVNSGNASMTGKQMKRITFCHDIYRNERWHRGGDGDLFNGGHE